MDALDRALAEREREDYRYEQACPECKVCGDKILDEYYYDINGEFYCEDCMHREFARSAPDYAWDHMYD